MGRDIEASLAEWVQKAHEDEDVMLELHALAHSGNMAAVWESFGHGPVFRGGGFVGLLGAGPACINVYTVRQITQGLASWLRGRREQRPVAVGYDGRPKSGVFAREAARVLAANGLFVWLYPSPASAEALSAAVESLGCCAGVCITAQGRTEAYSGCLILGEDGLPVSDAVGSALQRRVAWVAPFRDVKLVDFEPAADGGLIRMIRGDAVGTYLEKTVPQPQHAPGLPFAPAFAGAPATRLPEQ